MTTTVRSTNTRDLTPLFSPRSIAIVGASDDPTKYGNWLATRAVRDEKVRPAFLVNRSRSTVLGRPAVPTLSDLDSHVDLAVVAVPAAGFAAAIEDAIAANVGAVVAITAGLGEAGGEALERQDALVERLRDAGIPMLGPNCLGVLDNSSRLDATPNDFLPGSISIVSQSGNVAVDLAEQFARHGMGVARFASLGNSADLDVADIVNDCVDHAETQAIAVYCEGFKDGRKFAAAAARAARAGKPLVLMSVGRGDAATRGARSHTGSLVTSSLVLEAVCDATGAELVASPLEMTNLLQALLRTRPPRGRRVAVLADGGGHASLASDALEDVHLRVDEFSPALKIEIGFELPITAATANPIDTAGGGEQDISCFARVTERLVDTDEVDAVLMTGFFGGYGQVEAALADREDEVARSIGNLVDNAGASLIVQTMYTSSRAANTLRDAGIAVYRDVEHAAWSLNRLAGRAEAPAVVMPTMPEVRSPLTRAGYWAARRVLAAAGITFPRGAEVSTIEELESVIDKLRFPLVLKALGNEHKSDSNGVALNIADRHELLEVWADFQARLLPPTCSVEEMADLGGRVELIVGVRQDPTFGPIVLVGMGGVNAELLKDTRCALGPVTSSQARDLLLSLRGAALLTGFRGSSPKDLDAAADLVASLSQFAAEHPEIDEVECNPIAVGSHDTVALDARIVLGGH